LVQPDRQGLRPEEPVVRVGESRAEQGGSGGGRRHGGPLRGRRGSEPGVPVGAAAGRHLPAPAHPAGAHPQVGRHDAPAGDTHGARPHRSRRDPPRDRADLRARVRPAQLRLPPRQGVQGRAAAGGRAAQGRPPVRGGRGPEGLLRHDPARPPHDRGGQAGGRRPGAEADRVVPDGQRHGRPRAVDARGRRAAGRGAVAAAEQHLPQPARPT
jgi:hypothetical protein